MLDGRFDKALLMSVSLQFFDEIIAAAGIFRKLEARTRRRDCIIRKNKRQINQQFLIPSVADVGGKR